MLNRTFMAFVMGQKRQGREGLLQSVCIDLLRTLWGYGQFLDSICSIICLFLFMLVRPIDARIESVNETSTLYHKYLVVAIAECQF